MHLFHGCIAHLHETVASVAHDFDVMLAVQQTNAPNRRALQPKKGRIRDRRSRAPSVSTTLYSVPRHEKEQTAVERLPPRGVKALQSRNIPADVDHANKMEMSQVESAYVTLQH